MKELLAFDTDKIRNYNDSLCASNDSFSEKITDFQGKKFNCTSDEANNIINNYASMICIKLTSLKNKIEHFTNNVKLCCDDYDSNEENFEDVNLNDLALIIYKYADITNYNGSASSKLTSLSITKDTISLPEYLKNLVDNKIELSEYSTVNNAIANALEIANDNSHGYSQLTRWGNPNYDCSSLIITSYRNAGVDISKDTTYTGNMKQGFLNTGKFEWIPKSEITNLETGDILLKENSHTELYVGNNYNIGAHSNYDNVDGDSSGNEISIAPSKFTNYDGVLRYKEN